MDRQPVRIGSGGPHDLHGGAVQQLLSRRRIDEQHDVAGVGLPLFTLHDLRRCQRSGLLLRRQSTAHKMCGAIHLLQSFQLLGGVKPQLVQTNELADGCPGVSGVHCHVEAESRHVPVHAGRARSGTGWAAVS